MSELPPNVSEALKRRVAADGDAPFVRLGGDWVTTRQLDERAEHVAGALAGIGVTKGDRVALLLPNRFEIIEMVFGCARVGAVEVPLNAWLKGDFLKYQLADCRASVLVTDSAGFESAAPLLTETDITQVICVDEVDAAACPVPVLDYQTLVAEKRAAPDVEIESSDIMAIIYTSGTTGMPKGCMLSHGYFLAGPSGQIERGWVTPGDRTFTSWPLFHTSGQVIALMVSLLVPEGSVVFTEEFSASGYIDEARDAGATVLAGVGFMGSAIMATPPKDNDTDNDFRLAIWIPMKPDDQLAFEERFDTQVVAESYGQTECFPVTMSELTAGRERSTIGTPSPSFEVRLVDDNDEDVPVGEPGEIVVRPTLPYVMYSGYWEKPEATVAAWRNLWHHTGDLARQNDQGQFLFVDRKKDALRRRGENVSSVELEAAIMALDGVAAVAVCAVPSSMSEDDIKAVLVAEEGATLEPESVFAFFEEKLPYFAIPRYVHVRSELPANALGRVMKHVLRDEGVSDDMWDFEALGMTVSKDKKR